MLILKLLLVSNDSFSIRKYFINKIYIAEAGLLALRERRMRVTKKDFDTARERILYQKQDNGPAGLYL